MSEKPLVILASARKQGYTKKFLIKVFADKDYELVDLLDFYISTNELNAVTSQEAFIFS